LLFKKLAKQKRKGARGMGKGRETADRAEKKKDRQHQKKTTELAILFREGNIIYKTPSSLKRNEERRD